MLFRKLSIFAASILVLLLSILLSGCGEGSSGGLALTATAPTDSTPGTATATYTASDGSNPMGLEISFSTDSPDIIALSHTKVSVGSDGTATIAFRAVPVQTDTNVKIIASTGGLSQFKVITIKGTSSSSGGDGTTPPITPPTVPATPNSISFVQADPTTMTLKGMGGNGSETSILQFRVNDTANNPLSGIIVDFSLNTSVGGLTITPASRATDSNGLVSTIVNSGIIATPVRVTATVRDSNPPIRTQSDQLTVSTGVPDQAHFSVSVGTFNSESFDNDGRTVPITVLMADHFGNPVPDGTAVSFITSGGSIQPSCISQNGGCTVNWTSQDPRPANGRPVILAYAIGEESFIDKNGNGVADDGEFTDDPEAFLDLDFSGSYKSGDPFIDFNGNGQYDGPDGFYNGILRPASVPASVPKSKNVFKNVQLVMSTDGALISMTPAAITDPGQFEVTVTDMNGNTMAAGTTITVTASIGTLVGVTPYPVPNNLGNGAVLPFWLNAGTSPTFQTGQIRIDVKSPGGLTTTQFFPISGEF